LTRWLDATSCAIAIVARNTPVNTIYLRPARNNFTTTSEKPTAVTLLGGLEVAAGDP
jgi:hypothetical protein